MNPQSVKELRQLLPAWGAAVMAGGLLGLKPLVDGGGGLEMLLVGVASYGFFGGLTLVAATSFGTELHECTLPLLLTQPFSRSRLWKQKMLVLTAAIVAATTAVSVLLAGMSAWYSGDEVLNVVEAAFGDGEIFLASIFLVATVCSCGYWTLVAGSTIGGLVFTVAAQFISGLGVAFVLAKIRGLDEPFQKSPETLLALVVGGLAYSTIFLWLNWRKFVRLEVRNTRFSEGPGGFGEFDRRRPWSRLLVSRPTGKLLNLVRKELHLQLPIFHIAWVFALCWLAVLLMQWLRPRQTITYLFDVLICLYAPITSLLAGCVSLGEEKALGLTVPQLALPVSPFLQWFVKLIVSATTAAVLCVGLPLLFVWITGTSVDLSASGLMNRQDHGMEVLAGISALGFLLAFWAISLTPNTVRAALAAVVGAIVLGLCLALGVWCGNRTGALEGELFESIMCHFQLPPDNLLEQVGKWPAILVCCGGAAPIVVVMLRQSLKHFRRATLPGRTLVECSLVLVMLVLLITVWWIDGVTSIIQLPGSQPVQELKHALNALALTDPPSAQPRTRAVTPQELEGGISEQTRIWLRNAVVSYTRLPAPTVKTGYRQTSYQASVVFPNGRSFLFGGGDSADPFRRRYGFQ